MSRAHSHLLNWLDRALSRPALTRRAGRGKAKTRFRERRKARPVTAATTNETAAGAGVARSERFRKETPRPHHAPRGREHAGHELRATHRARSTGATTETTDHEPREASASVLTTQARGQRGRRREARTNHRRGLAARSRKADPNRQGPRSGPQTKRDKGSVRSAEAAQNKRNSARFMTAPPRARGACGHGGGSEKRPRKPRTNATARRAWRRT